MDKRTQIAAQLMAAQRIHHGLLVSGGQGYVWNAKEQAHDAVREANILLEVLEMHKPLDKK
jgi:hypothetical protein